MFKILIDADGCPVVDETIDLAMQYEVPVTLVADTSHVDVYKRQALHSLFSVTTISMEQLLMIYVLAFVPTIIIQGVKMARHQ